MKLMPAIITMAPARIISQGDTVKPLAASGVGWLELVVPVLAPSTVTSALGFD